MDYEAIRKMNDRELAEFLRGISNRDTSKCSRCNRAPRYHIKIENLKTYQTKRLCTICEDCYKQLLKDMKAVDIIWN